MLTICPCLIANSGLISPTTGYHGLVRGGRSIKVLSIRVSKSAKRYLASIHRSATRLAMTCSKRDPAL